MHGKKVDRCGFSTFDRRNEYFPSFQTVWKFVKKQMEQFSRVFFSFIGERRSFHFSPFAFTRRKALDNDKFEIPKRFSQPKLNPVVCRKIEEGMVICKHEMYAITSHALRFRKKSLSL